MPKPREVAAAVVDAANAHDEQRIRSLYADDVIFRAPGDVMLQGADAAVGYFMSWLRAFPDARLTVEAEVADGDWVAQRFVFEGTHEETLAGPDADIPATHRRLRGDGMEFIRVRDGKIVEDHLCFDQVQVLTQLGLMPELTAAASGA